MYKTLSEVQELISLGKPIAVIDMFIGSYLQGIEYDKWAEGKDLSEVESVVIGVDEDGNDIIGEKLVNVYEPLDVSVSVAQWKIDNYAILRKAEYPPMAEYLDAVVKGDTKAQEAHIAKCKEVKEKYPK